MPAEATPESGQGRSWRSTPSVEDVETAELKLLELGDTWQWNEDGSLSAQSAALSAVKLLSDGRKVLFNQIIAPYLG